jgi:hypothetical protein
LRLWQFRQRLRRLLCCEQRESERNRAAKQPRRKPRSLRQISPLPIPVKMRLNWNHALL